MNTFLFFLRKYSLGNNKREENSNISRLNSVVYDTSLCLGMFQCVCVYVCVREKERSRERLSHRDTEKKGLDIL